MPRKLPAEKNRVVYSSGLDRSDTALNSKVSPIIGMDAHTKRANFRGVAKPSESQKYTFQRGMAWAALQLPHEEQVEALAEVLDMLELRNRIMPRWRE